MSLWCELLHEIAGFGFCCCISLGILAVRACTLPCWGCASVWVLGVTRRTVTLSEMGTGQPCTKAASIFMRWLKFLQLKTSHTLVESLVWGFFGLKIYSKLYILIRIKKTVLHSFTRLWKIRLVFGKWGVQIWPLYQVFWPLNYPWIWGSDLI